MERIQTDFHDLLISMRSGSVMMDLNEKFNEVLAAVLETGGKGKLTIDINIEPARMGVGGCVLEVKTQHTTKLKKPQHDIGSSTFFVDSEGKLVRDDPTQTAMFEQADERAARNAKATGRASQ